MILKNGFQRQIKVVSKFDGFVSRRLLETKDGQHRVLVEFESLEKFGKMHQSPEHEQLTLKGLIIYGISPISQSFTML